MAQPDPKVDLIMSRLSPEARATLSVLAQMQDREPEDVLRDEIQKYVRGRVPAIDLEGVTQYIKARSYSAGFLFGRLRRFTRRIREE